MSGYVDGLWFFAVWWLAFVAVFVLVGAVAWVGRRVVWVVWALGVRVQESRARRAALRARAAGVLVSVGSRRGRWYR